MPPADRSSIRRKRSLRVERLESRIVLSGGAALPTVKMVPAVTPAITPALVMPPLGASTPNAPLITPSDVNTILNTAEHASVDRNAIIAIVDRNGDVLGVRVENKVPITDQLTMVYAIDGAVALARTGAFFASGGDPNLPTGAPLTSRTVEFISQSTITQREVQSNPDIANQNSPLAGPGYVAPIGLGNHFPPAVMNAPQVDLFGIEQTNRTSLGIPTSDLTIDATTGLPVVLPNTESYGVQTGLLPGGVSRGIATLPGGIPLYKNGVLVGGIGVFFPGPTGDASYEQGFTPTTPANELNAELQRVNAPMVLEAEWMAFAAAGGTREIIGPLPSSLLLPEPSAPGYGLPLGNLSLVGVTLDVFGQHGVVQGRMQLLATAKRVGAFTAAAMANVSEISADISSPFNPVALDAPGHYKTGVTPPEGWLVAPHDAAPGNGGLTAADVTQIIDQGYAQALQTRAAIRLKIPSGQSANAEYVFAVADTHGNILGLFRMADATIFSIDVAVAKARNTAYYASADLQSGDQVAGIPVGTAFTNRTFRALAEPRFPGGIDGAAPGPFSSLLAPGINPLTGENVGAPRPANAYETATTPDYMYTSFMVGANFHDPNDKANQNGVVWFPGSSPLYLGAGAAPPLAGGFGVSGDGVDQDDVATIAGQQGFAAPAMIRADQFVVKGVRLPYQKDDRNPSGGL